MTMKHPWQVDWNLKLFRRPTGGHFAESGPDKDGQPQDRLNELCPVVPCLFGQIDERSTNSELLGSIKYMFTVHLPNGAGLPETWQVLHDCKKGFWMDMRC